MQDANITDMKSDASAGAWRYEADSIARFPFSQSFRTSIAASVPQESRKCNKLRELIVYESLYHLWLAVCAVLGQSPFRQFENPRSWWPRSRQRYSGAVSVNLAQNSEVSQSQRQSWERDGRPERVWTNQPHRLLVNSRRTFWLSITHSACPWPIFAYVTNSPLLGSKQ